MTYYQIDFLQVKNYRNTNFYPDAHHQTGRMRLGGKYDNADFLDLRMRGDDTRREDFKLSIS